MKWGKAGGFVTEVRRGGNFVTLTTRSLGRGKFLAHLFVFPSAFGSTFFLGSQDAHLQCASEKYCLEAGQLVQAPFPL